MKDTHEMINALNAQIAKYFSFKFQITDDYDVHTNIK